MEIAEKVREYQTIKENIDPVLTTNGINHKPVVFANEKELSELIKVMESFLNMYDNNVDLSEE